MPKTAEFIPDGVSAVNVAGLAAELRRHVDGEVRFDDGARAMYATDSSNFRQVPIGVVIPRTLDDVIATVRAARRYGAPVLSRGGGTSLSGETVNVAVVMDFSKYLNRIGDFDPERTAVTVEPGVINEQLNRAVGAAHGFVFGPDPSTHSRCTLGGNIGNNSCGIHSVQAHFYGPGPRTSDNVDALEVLTYDGARFWVGVNEEPHLDEIIAAGGRKGEIYARLRDLRDRYAEDIRAGYPSVEQMPRRVSGYNLDELLAENGFNVARALTGTEGTCVTVLQARVLLTPAMLHRSTVVMRHDDIAAAATHVKRILEWKPIGLEGIDDRLFHDQQVQGLNPDGLGDLPGGSGNAWLLVQFGADEPAEAQQRAEQFSRWACEELGHHDDDVLISRSVADGGDSETIWKLREAGLGATAFPPGEIDHWPGWEDSAVPPERLGDYLRDLQALYAEHGLRGAFYGHFGEGCIHSRISFDLRTAEGLRTYRSFLQDAADLVGRYGGSLSGEHGDGQQRAELLDRQYSPPVMAAMREFKGIWDPDAKMNPGKVVDPYRLDENLRLGTDYNPARPQVRFAYAEDGGDFAHAALRCVGVGSCRVPDAQATMCPSYQVTRDEQHSTRGRSRLLYEMLEGEVITDGWQSREVAEALDLCLACKGCTNDCPVNVDMPTYKAEFRAHHYRSWRRWRPRHAYAFGFIDQASRLASRAPGLVNVLTQTPGVRRLARFAGGIDQRRDLPAFAPVTLQQWFAERGGTANPAGRPVVLFPDTFNNHLHTDVGVACVQAIEAAGWQVIMPEGHLCCGRPLYDYGFLTAAERYLRRVLDALREHIRAGVPIVGMEPSCLAVFRDELAGMLPHDDDARRLARSAYHFAEFFTAFDIDVPPLDRDALLWGHCHHRATGGVEADQQVLERMGARVEPVTGGCCGVAGAWGFEDGRYDISVDCGEQALLPAVRATDPDTVVVADGFSCQTQIAQTTERRALHIAQVMSMARQLGPAGRGGGRPEEPYYRARPGASPRRRAARAAGAGALAGMVAGAGRLIYGLRR